MYWQREVQMFIFRSAKSSIIFKTNNGIIRKNKGSTTITNRKCKISIKEVHILNFEQYTNTMIFIFLLRWALPLFLQHNKKSHNSKIQWKIKWLFKYVLNAWPNFDHIKPCFRCVFKGCNRSALLCWAF
jgi:hypothetical protein